MKNTLKTIVISLELFCNENNISHRFVGGVSFGGLLNKRTTWKINLAQKIIYLYNHNALNIYRSDNTIRDIDIIILATNIEKIYLLRDYIQTLKITSAQQNTEVPFISFEPILTTKNLLFRRKILQLVTALVAYNKQFFFVYGPIHQRISVTSLEPWKVVLSDNTTYTVRNPIADYFAYQFRNPSGTKPKDIEKLQYLNRLAEDVIKKGKKYNINYLSRTYYQPWRKYVLKLQHAQNFDIVVKRIFLRYYWKTVGNYVAHGKGLSKYVLQLSNKFTG